VIASFRCGASEQRSHAADRRGHRDRHTRFACVLVTIIATVWFAASGTLQSARASGTGQIAGTAQSVGMLGATPEPNVVVTARDGNASEAGATTTDASGGYTLTLAPGAYTVTFEKTGFVSECRAASAQEGQRTPVSVTMFTPSQHGVLQGTVTNATGGSPIPSVSIELRVRDGCGTAATATTSAMGKYGLSLPPDDYIASFSAPGFTPVASPVEIDPGVTTTLDEALQPDTTAPSTSIGAGPAAFLRSTTARFSFASSEAGSSFECRLDATAFTSCSSPKSYTGLSETRHTFAVRAIDRAGNIDATPAARSFTVDTRPPQTTITSGPSGRTTHRRPTFSFKASEANSSFKCALDSGAYQACSSPRMTRKLGFGRHTFRVRARDRAGNRDVTPATRTFKIVH
jgi:hypothetical protein